MSIKSIILKKGWAGKTISRPETAERVNALIKPLIEILHSYNAMLASASGSEVKDVESALPTLRADIGKLAETVHSCGVTAYSGVELEPDAFSGSTSSWNDIADLEAAYQNRLGEEGQIEHQMRTRAIIDVMTANSKARLQLISIR